MLIYQSYNGKLDRVYPSLILITFRNMIPMLNLDGEIDFYNKKNGHMMLTMQICIMVYSKTMIVSLKLRYKWVFASIIVFGIFYSIVSNYYDLEDFDKAENLVIVCGFGVVTMLFQVLFLYH